MSDNTEPDFGQSEDFSELMEMIDKVILEPISILMDFLQDINVDVIKKSFFLC